MQALKLLREFDGPARKMAHCRVRPLACMQTTLVIGKNAKNASSLNFWTRCIHLLKLRSKFGATAHSYKFNANTCIV